MIRRSNKSKRKLIQFHTSELKNNQELLLDVVDDYLGYYWSDMKHADAEAIQVKLQMHTQRKIPMKIVNERKDFISKCAEMEQRNEKNRNSAVRKHIVKYLEKKERTDALIARRNQINQRATTAKTSPPRMMQRDEDISSTIAQAPDSFFVTGNQIQQSTDAEIHEQQIPC
jgi:hypothetical protein